MKLAEEIRKDRETFANLENRKAKLAFLWDYYKLPIAGIVLAMIIVVASLVNLIFRKPVALYAVLVNSDAQIIEVDDDVFNRELEKAGIKMGKSVVDINDYLTLGMDNREEDDIETLQVLNALFSITDLDVFVGFKNDFDMFIEGDAFLDLSEHIDEGILSKRKDDLYSYKNSEGKMIVGGIVLHPGSPLHEAYYYHNDVLIGVASNAANLDNALALIEQLLRD